MFMPRFLSGLRDKLFKLTAGMKGGDVCEFVYDAGGRAFLKKELVEFGVDRYYCFRVNDRICGLVPNHVF